MFIYDHLYMLAVLEAATSKESLGESGTTPAYHKHSFLIKFKNKFKQVSNKYVDYTHKLMPCL